MTDDLGTPPKTGWNLMVPELIVTDLSASLAFWRGILGFEIAYHRPQERFAYLDLAGAQIMLRQRDGKWETGPLDAPLGRGAMFQIKTPDLGGVEARIAAAGWPIHTGPREVWRRTGDQESGQREVIVQDPDGYLIMMNEGLGQRPLTTPAPGA